jgi:hypothetical protein
MARPACLFGAIEPKEGSRASSRAATLGRFDSFVTGLGNDCYLRNLRLQPKTAFSRFALVRRTILKVSKGSKFPVRHPVGE